MTPPSTIDVKLERPEVVWSPDGRFISMLDAERGGDEIELVQVNGAVPSPRVAISPAGGADSMSIWPPVFP